MFTILIADRNPHVRKLLERELRAEGYQVRLAENAREVFKWTFHHEPLHLIILDPDLPDAADVSILEKLLDRIPALPVVVHTYPSDYEKDSKDMNDVVFVEKRGSSVERLLQVVHETLIDSHSRRQKI
jgi:DNA-binding NtrC family response regulator